jgi:hypothetical protein
MRPIQVLAVSLVAACLSFAAANVPVGGEDAARGVSAATRAEAVWFAGIGDGDGERIRPERNLSASAR